MRIHYLQHVPFEGPEHIGVWAKERGHDLTGTALYDGSPLPACGDFDMLVVMGGPMGVYDEQDYPWMRAEKNLIRDAIEQGKLVLGVCLGAQLIAEAIGGEVYRNAHKELGWFPVKLSGQAKETGFFREFQETFTPFHWHGDTFRLPEEAVHAASSEGCLNQAFVYRDHVVGLQFHLESSDASIDRLLRHCADDIEPGGPYIQTPGQMRGQLDWLEQSNSLLYKLLDAMELRCAHGE